MECARFLCAARVAPEERVHPDRRPCTLKPGAIREVAMKATALVHAYVKLDRFVFFQLQNHPASPGHLDWVKQRLGK